jgi:glycosyltransferase involved in cell wall biosynthesis
MTKLLSINNYFYPRGGAETVFFGHNRLLEGVGWDVVPFAMHHADNYQSPWSEYFVEEIQFGTDYSLVEKLRKVPKVIYSREAQRKLAKLVDKVQPSIAHAHNIYHHISPSILAVLKQREIPTILTLHDLKLICPAYTMLAPDGICERCKTGAFYNVVRHRCVKNSAVLSGIIYAENLVNRIIGSYRKNVSRFIVPSRFYLEKMVESGWERSRFSYIPNFIDVKSYIPDFSPGSYFLYFGRLRRQKGLSTLIRAAGIAGVELRIAGTGPEETALRELSAQTRADVKFLGFLSGAGLHDQIRGSRATVLPSEWYENAPMSVLESYAFGKPVLGADIGGIPELIRNQETGIIFESGNPHELAKVLLGCAESSQQRIEEMGREGRNWVERQFSVDPYRERILKLYSEF